MVIADRTSECACGVGFEIVVLIPDALAASTVLREGDAGRGWLERLPFIVAAACERWGCTPDVDFWHGQVALIVPVGHSSGPGVLKVASRTRETSARQTRFAVSAATALCGSSTPTTQGLCC